MIQCRSCSFGGSSSVSRRLRVAGTLTPHKLPKLLVCWEFARDLVQSKPFSLNQVTRL